jgi:phage-related protein
MTAKGTPAAQATTQLNGLFAELGKSGTVASDNLALAAENTQYAGMSFQDMMDAGVPLNEVLDMMGTYAADNGMGMLDMFSSIDAGKAALANSGESALGFTDALAAMTTETDVVGEAYDKISDTSADKFNKILNELKNTAIDLFLQIEPLIEEALPVLQQVLEMLIPPLMNLVETLLPVLLDLFETLLPAIMPLIEEALPVIIELFQKLLPPITEIIKKLLPPLIKLIDALLPIFLELIDILMPIIDLFVELLDPIIDLINTAVLPLIKALMPLVDLILDILKPALEVIMSVFKEVFEGIAGYVTDQIKIVTDILKNIIDFIKNVFTGNWKGAWDNIKNIFSNIAEGLKNAFKAPINWIIDGINGFIKGINMLKIPDWVPVVGGKGINLPTIPRLKVGMDYVPSDYFPAFLDKGEAVLTADEAAIYRSLGSNLEGLLSAPIIRSQDMADYDRTNQSIKVVGEIHTHVEMDNREVAIAITPFVSEELNFGG